MTLTVYGDPVQHVDNVSSLGLRHVGYGILTDLFVPFTPCACDVASAATSAPVAVDSFSWSLGLIARRSINMAVKVGPLSRLMKLPPYLQYIIDCVLVITLKFYGDPV